MLKQAVAALLLANLGTALYTQGGLRWLGLGAVDEREPQRLAQQLHPERLQLLTAATPATTAAAPQPAPVPTTPAALTPAAAVPTPTVPPVASMTPPAATPAPAASMAPATALSSPSVPTAAKPAEAPSPAPAQPQNHDKTEQPAPTKAPAQPEKTDKPAGQPTKAEKQKPATDKAQDPTPAKTVAKRRGKTSCWQASGYTPVQTIVLNGALDRVPELDKRWQIVATSSGGAGRWLVYQGGFASADALKQQRAEYKLANIDHRPLQLPGESGPGLVLGTYSSEAGAQRALQNAQRDGASNLRVVPEKGGSAARSYTLTLKAITEEEKALVEGLGPALAGKTLQRCP